MSKKLVLFLTAMLAIFANTLMGFCENQGQGAVVTLYKDVNYRGYAVNLNEGEYTLESLKKLGIKDNDISSLKFKKSGYTVEIFNKNNFEEKLQSLIKNEPNFIKLRCNDKLTSVKIIKNTVTPTIKPTIKPTIVPTIKPTIIPTPILEPAWNPKHYIHSKKPFDVKIPDLSYQNGIDSGIVDIKWFDFKDEASVLAEFKIDKSNYVFRSDKITKVDSFEGYIIGQFSVEKDGKSLISGMNGRVYGLNLKSGEYFKFYSDDQKWHFSAYIENREDETSFLHKIYSDKPMTIYQFNEWRTPSKGSAVIAWNKIINKAYFHAEQYLDNDIYTFDLIEPTTIDDNEMEIKGIFNVYKNGNLLHERKEGTIGCLGKNDSYFKFALSENGNNEFRMGAYITERKDMSDLKVLESKESVAFISNGNFYLTPELNPDVKVFCLYDTNNYYVSAKISTPKGIYEFIQNNTIGNSNLPEGSIAGKFDVLLNGECIEKDVYFNIYGLSDKNPKANKNLYFCSQNGKYTFINLITTQMRKILF